MSFWKESVRWGLWMVICGGGVGCTGTLSLEGEWRVNWVYTDSAELWQPDVAYTMRGEMDFFSDKKVKIVAYGTSTSIFRKDTLTHTLDWQLIGDTLHIQRHDTTLLTYSLRRETEDTLFFKLVEGIELRLMRK